jgi:hypothetical protein
MTTKRVLILGANSSVAEATDLRLCGAAGVFVAVQDLGAVPAGEVTGLFLGSVMQLGGLDQVLLVPLKPGYDLQLFITC